MSARKFSILTIDDDRARDESYAAFALRLNLTFAEFGFSFSIRCASGIEEALVLVASRTHDLILLDQILELDGWAQNRELLVSAIVKSRAPIVLVSADFNSRPAISMIGTIIRHRANHVLGAFRFLDDIDKSLDHISEKIPHQTASLWMTAILGAAELESAFRPDSVAFLHLTDSHFGQKEGADVISASALDLSMLKELFRSRGWRSSAIIWSGDVSNTAMPAEYALAKEFVVEARRRDLVMQEAPIFVVPGNHDINWPLVLGSRIAFEETPNGWASLVKDYPEGPRADLAIYGLEPFQKFCENIGSDRCSIDRGFDLDCRFRHLGFVVLRIYDELHDVRSRKSGPSVNTVQAPSFDRKYGDALEMVMSAGIPDDSLLLVLGHRSDPVESTVKEVRSTVIRQLASRFAVVEVCGHVHEAVNEYKRSDGVGFLRLVGAPHSRFSDRSSLVLPSLSYIEFSTSDSRPKISVSRLTRLPLQWSVSRSEEWTFDAERRWVDRPLT